MLLSVVSLSYINHHRYNNNVSFGGGESIAHSHHKVYTKKTMSNRVQYFRAKIPSRFFRNQQNIAETTFYTALYRPCTKFLYDFMTKRMRYRRIATS